MVRSVEEICEILTRSLERQPTVLEAYRFGSIARGEAVQVSAAIAPVS